jgi:hypothetical protein
VNGQVVRLKILAVTGDCSALKIALNFKAHNDYHCCYFCYLRGVHRDGKRQYSYECPYELRTTASFTRDASIASRFDRNERGHLGVSILAHVVDVPFPHAIIIDYAHASLLRHSKAMLSELYRRLRPAVRGHVDLALSSQAFPHLFHRRMKALQDLSFVKATEVRNTLFYGFLPLFHLRLPLDILSHFALYIVSMRLYHGRPIFSNRTGEIADDLFSRYNQDFPSLHQGLENFVLHLHAHYHNQ